MLCLALLRREELLGGSSICLRGGAAWGEGEEAVDVEVVVVLLLLDLDCDPSCRQRKEDGCLAAPVDDPGIPLLSVELGPGDDCSLRFEGCPGTRTCALIFRTASVSFSRCTAGTGFLVITRTLPCKASSTPRAWCWPRAPFAGQPEPWKRVPT